MEHPIDVRPPTLATPRFTDLRKRWSRAMATRRALEALDEDIPQPAFDANAGEIQGVMQDMAPRPASDLSAAILKFRALEFQIHEWASDNDGPPTATFLPLLESLGTDLERLARPSRRRTTPPSEKVPLGDGERRAGRPLTNMRNVSHTAP